MQIYVPEYGAKLYLTKDWKISLNAYNGKALVKKFGLGEMRRVERYRYYYRETRVETKRSIFGPQTITTEMDVCYYDERTDKGPLLRKDDISYNTFHWTPGAEVVIPRGTEVEVGAIETRRNRTGFLKFILKSSPNKKLNKGRLYVDLAQAETAEWSREPVAEVTHEDTNRFEKQEIE